MSLTTVPPEERRSARPKRSVEARLRMSAAASQRWERERRAGGVGEAERALRRAATRHKEPI
jgi:hypothetical protein